MVCYGFHADKIVERIDFRWKIKSAAFIVSMLLLALPIEALSRRWASLIEIELILTSWLGDATLSKALAAIELYPFLFDYSAAGAFAQIPVAEYLISLT